MFGNKTCFALVWVLHTGTAFSAKEARPHVITLPIALEYALEQSPEIAAARQDVRAQEGRLLQARLPDNPEIGVEAENFDATGAMEEETRVVTLGLSQTVDLSRFSRASAASRELDLARLVFESIRLRTRIRIRQRFTALIAAQERRSLSEEIGILVRSAHGLAVEKVKSGKASPLDSLQSFVALNLAAIDSGKVDQALSVARRELAQSCGYGEPDFDSGQGSLDATVPPPEWKEVESKLNAIPDWIRTESETRLRDAELRAEQAMRLPALTFEAGIRQVPDRNGRAFIAGVSLPFPLWNWNQGAIRAAEARKTKAGEEGKARRIDIMNRLADIHGQAVSTYREAALLATAVLPAAKATFEGIQEAYRVGKFGSLESLNAQRALFEAQAHYLETLAEHQSAMAELEEMLGADSLSRKAE